jgi:hypothetical protein
MALMSEAGLTDQLALDLDLDLSGTTGNGSLGRVLHGGAGVVLRFWNGSRAQSRIMVL